MNKIKISYTMKMNDAFQPCYFLHVSLLDVDNNKELARKDYDLNELTTDYQVQDEFIYELKDSPTVFNRVDLLALPASSDPIINAAKNILEKKIKVEGLIDTGGIDRESYMPNDIVIKAEDKILVAPADPVIDAATSVLKKHVEIPLEERQIIQK